MTQITDLMKGKKGLIMGVANEHSIAWGIAETLHAHGAELAFSYQGEVFEKRIKPLAERVGSTLTIPCEVTSDESIKALFETLEKEWGHLDFVVHAIAFSDKDELRGKYVETSRDNFKNSLDISCYSFTAVAQAAAPLMKEGGSMLTLSYYGAEKVIPNYNVMGVAKAALECSVKYLAADLGVDGIRVNSVSAGPIRTLASSGIGGIGKMLKFARQTAPLKRNTTRQDVGNAALYFLSNLGAGVTGENHYVDAGYNIIGMGVAEE